MGSIWINEYSRNIFNLDKYNGLLNNHQCCIFWSINQNGSPRMIAASDHDHQQCEVHGMEYVNIKISAMSQWINCGQKM